MTSESPLILVADDDKSTRILLRLILQQEGYEIIEAENGQECLTAWQEHQPDMILLDAMMPIVDGFSCCQQIREQQEQDLTIPVLMITGLNDKKSVDRAFAAGATDYITKPIHPPVLRQRLKRILKAAQAEVALKESEEKYRSVVNNLKEVIFQTDSAGKLTFLNPAWTEITGFSVKESLGKNLSQFIDCRDRNFHQQQLQTLLSQEQADCRYQIRYLTKKNNIGWLEVYACTNVKANVMKIFGSGNDISDRKCREQYQQTEHEATKILATSTSLEAAIKEIIQTFCHCLQWDVGEFWHQQNDVLACYQIESLNTHEFQDFIQTTKQITFNLNSELPGRIWTTREFYWISNFKEDLSFIRFQVATESKLKIGFGFPIMSGDEILGVMIFFSRQLQQFNDNLLQITRAIGSQIGQFIKRQEAELQLQQQHLILQSELAQASDYVHSLLPQPLTEKIKIEQIFVPSTQLGGDIFDYYWLDANHLVVYLLDVAGHGVKSALLSISILNILRTQSLYNTDFYDPWTVLTALNQIFPMNEKGDNYFTIWYGVFNLTERELVYASAGHPPAIKLTKSYQNITKLTNNNIPIGMFDVYDFEQGYCSIDPEDCIYLFSDGVYEIPQEDGKIWGLAALIELLKASQRCHDLNLKKIWHYIQSKHKNQTLDDDFSLLKISI
ncbi:MAG: hypothetical protein Tsb0014_01240 [Pleurocapsa sp.]